MNVRLRWAAVVGTVVAVACGGQLSPSSTDAGSGEDAGGHGGAASSLDAGLGSTGSSGGGSSSGPVASSSSSGGPVSSSSGSACTTPSGASSGIGPVEWACWKADDGGTASDEECVLGCCVKAHPMGGMAFVDVARACACGSTGPCAQPCADEFCADGTIAAYGDECSTCLYKAVMGPCAQDIQCHCGIIDCNMTFQCQRGCP